MQDAETNLTVVLTGVMESLSKEVAMDGAAFLSTKQMVLIVNRAKDNDWWSRKRSVTRTAKEVGTRCGAAERVPARQMAEHSGR